MVKYGNPKHNLICRMLGHRTKKSGVSRSEKCQRCDSIYYSHGDSGFWVGGDLVRKQERLNDD